MRAFLFWSALAVRYVAVEAVMAWRDCVDFQLNQNSGAINLTCPFYDGPEEIGNSSLNWGLKVPRNDLASGQDYGFTFTNNNYYGLHFITEFDNTLLGLEWRSYFVPGYYYCTTTFPGPMRRYQLTC